MRSCLARYNWMLAILLNALIIIRLRRPTAPLLRCRITAVDQIHTRGLNFKMADGEIGDQRTHSLISGAMVAPSSHSQERHSGIRAMWAVRGQYSHLSDTTGKERTIAKEHE